jgi:chromate transporter
MSIDTPAPGPDPTERPASCTDLFLTFTRLALQGFGGVLPVVQRELCERRRWLTKEQFLETLALGQVLPGPNVCNVSLMVGDRFFGTRGAFAALAGMMSVPLVLVLALTALYAQFAANEVVAGALRGMGAVAGGLIAATGIKLIPALRRHPLGFGACLGIVALVFGAIAFARIPLGWVLLAVGGVACVWTWRRLQA